MTKESEKVIALSGATGTAYKNEKKDNKDNQILELLLITVITITVCVTIICCTPEDSDDNVVIREIYR